MSIGSPKKVKIVNGQRTDRPSTKIKINEVPEEKTSVDDAVGADIPTPSYKDVILEKPVVPEEDHPQPIDPNEKSILKKQEDEADMEALRAIVNDTSKPKKAKKTRKYKKGDNNE